MRDWVILMAQASAVSSGLSLIAIIAAVLVN
jgi:hypothetical protein